MEILINILLIFLMLLLGLGIRAAIAINIDSNSFSERLPYTRDYSTQFPWADYNEYLILDWAMWCKGYYKDIPSILQSPKYNATRFLLWHNSETMRVGLYSIVLYFSRLFVSHPTLQNITFLEHKTWLDCASCPLDRHDLQNLKNDDVILVELRSLQTINKAKIGIRKISPNKVEVFYPYRWSKTYSYNLPSDSCSLKNFILHSLKHTNPQITNVSLISPNDKMKTELIQFINKYFTSLSKTDRFFFLYYNPFISYLLDLLPSVIQPIIEITFNYNMATFFLFLSPQKI